MSDFLLLNVGTTATVAAAGGDALLKEDGAGNYILLEDGTSRILLET